jgi:hypothetical protein
MFDLRTIVLVIPVVLVGISSVFGPGDFGNARIAAT